MTSDIHRDGMLLIGLLVGILIATGRFATPVDGLNYWSAGTSTQLYPESWSDVRAGVLFYPPPVAQLVMALHPIGWPAFITLLTVATFAAFWYCAREWSIPLVLVGIPYYLTGIPVLSIPATFLTYALLGNLQWIMAAVSLFVIRRPALWSVLLLTKVTTAVGWWWHPLRGEWHAAAVGAVVTALVMAVSFLLAPQLWVEFAGFVARNYQMVAPPIPLFPVPLGIRIATALLLIVWGARTDRPWTVPVATGWALPALYGLGFLPYWIGPIREAWAARRH